MTIHVRVRCEGITPILFNRKSEELLQQLWAPDKKAKTAPRLPPREHAEKCLYTQPDGKHYIPGEMLMSSLIAAGSFVRLEGRRQISSAKSTTLPAFLTLLDSALVLPHQQWEVDMRGGVNPGGGQAVCVVRPRFDKWGFEVNVLIENEEIDEAKIRELFDKAGVRMGLGDFRPQKRGIFGKFKVVSEPHRHSEAAE